MSKKLTKQLTKQEKNDPSDCVQGAKFLKYIQQAINELPEREFAKTHPNQKNVLQYRTVATAYLLAFFNPILRSLRVLEDFSKTPKGKRYFQMDKIPRSTFSDFVSTLPAAPLKPLMQDLLEQAKRKQKIPVAELPETLQHVLAVDGTFLRAAADMAWALGNSLAKAKQQAASTSAPSGSDAPEKNPSPEDVEAPRQGVTKAKIRIDAHVRIDNWLPEVLQVHGTDATEAESAAEQITPGAVHIYDRGIFSQALVRAHLDKGGWFVNRVRVGRRCPVFHASEEWELTDRDLEANVVSDGVGRLCASGRRRGVDADVREVMVRTDEGKYLRLVTNLMDAPAWVVVLLYQYRWQVELFFRWLKTFARWDHLLNQTRNGVEIQMYMAIIGLLLIYLLSGDKPSKYDYALLNLVFTGQATLEEILPILIDRKRACQREREARRRKKEHPDQPKRRYGLSSRMW